MTHGLQWGNDCFTLELQWSENTAPTLRRIQLGTTELEPQAGVPAIEILTVEHGHTLASKRLAHTQLGESMRYVSHELRRSEAGTRLMLTVRDDAGCVEATLVWSCQPGIAALRSSVLVRNLGPRALALRSIASWAAHLGAPARAASDDWRLHQAASDWLGEGRWSDQPLRGAGFPELHQQLTHHDPRGGLSVVSTGTWSTGAHLPMGVLSSARAGLALGWQIEANSPWRWEIGEDSDDRYLAVSGPTEPDHQWLKVLETGESFESVGTLLALGEDFTSVVGALTRFRRATRRQHPDNLAPAIVFNDYMNTINGDPSEDKLRPLIDAASAAGAEVFCIDAGWYDDGGDWWDSVGEWMPSQRRFPHGLRGLVDQIRDRGMTPGLWLEPEVVGVRSPVASQLPGDAFVQRAGQRIIEHDRFHLDLRHPAAREHLDGVIDRLVVGLGVGYFKFDYNIDPGTGSDLAADSAGDGLLEHARAYLDWIDGILDRHPEVILENCASGGMRADAATLAHFQLQSTSDQQDPHAYPPIAAAAPASILPEQAASWAYPQPGMTAEQAAFTLVTGLSGRFYFSGHLDRMQPETARLVAEAVAAAKQLRTLLPTAVPFWPLGLPGWDDPWVALGYSTPSESFLLLWNRSADHDSITLPLELDPLELETVFPRSLPSWKFQRGAERGTTLLRNPTAVPSARLFRLAPLSAGSDH